MKNEHRVVGQTPHLHRMSKAWMVDVPYTFSFSAIGDRYGFFGSYKFRDQGDMPTMIRPLLRLCLGVWGVCVWEG